MELRVLRYFLTVAREQNISRAAKALNLTQPTLSRQLHDLEEELGMELFERGTRKITLNPQGILLTRRAAEILDLVDHTTKELAGLDAGLSGTLRIGTSGVGMGPLAAGFQKQCPDVTFVVESMPRHEIISGVENGLLDFGLIQGPFEDSRLESFVLDGDTELQVLLDPQSDLAGKLYFTPEDLAGKRVACLDETAIKDLYSQWLGSPCAYSFLSRDGMDLVQYVLAGGMPAVLPVDGNTENLGTLEWRPLRPAVRMEHLLVWKQGSASKAFQAFLQYAKKREG